MLVKIIITILLIIGFVFLYYPWNLIAWVALIVFLALLLVRKI